MDPSRTGTGVIELDGRPHVHHRQPGAVPASRSAVVSHPVVGHAVVSLPVIRHVGAPSAPPARQARRRLRASLASGPVCALDASPDDGIVLPPSAPAPASSPDSLPAGVPEPASDSEPASDPGADPDPDHEPVLDPDPHPGPALAPGPHPVADPAPGEGVSAASAEIFEIDGQLELFPADEAPVLRPLPPDPLDLPETEVWWDVAVPDLGPAGSVLRVQQLHALVARTQSLWVEALAAVQGSSHGDDVGPGEDRPAAGVAHDALIDELAPLLAMGRTALRRRLEEADQLQRCLPRTATLFSEGLIDHPQVAAVVRETAQLTVAQAIEVDAAIVSDLIGVTTGAVGELVRTEVARIDAEAVRRRSQARTRERRVVFTPLADGMASLTATGPAPQVRTWWDLLDAGCRDRTRPGAQHDPYAEALAEEAGQAGGGALARGAGSAATDGPARDGRGADARRFDALGELVEQGFAAAPTLGLGAGPQLVVALSALLGVDDEPASLTGCGPVPAWLARCAGRAHRSRVALVDEHDGGLLGVDPQTLPPGTFDALVSAARASRETSHGRRQPPPGTGVVVADRSTAGAPGHDRGGEPPGGVRSPDTGRLDTGETDLLVGEMGVAAAEDHMIAGVRAPGRGGAGGRHRAGVGRPRDRCGVAAVGGGSYTIPAGVRRVVALRGTRCCAPGCRVPASRCDLDHVVPWPAGPTCACNLAPLCRTHHRMKHERGWTLTWASQDPDDPALVWCSPGGVEHLVEPPPLLHRHTGTVRAALRAALVAAALGAGQGSTAGGGAVGRGVAGVDSGGRGPGRSAPTTRPEPGTYPPSAQVHDADDPPY